MTEALLRIAADAVQLAPIAIAVLLGVLAIRAFRGERMRARPERWLAVGLIVVAALAVAVVVELYVAAFTGMDTGVTLQTYLTVLPAAAIALVGGLLAGLVGYVAVARAWRSRGAAVGGAIGPPALLLLTLGAGAVSLALQNAAFEAGSAAAATVLEDRSAGITLRTELLEATMADDGTAVASLRVRVTLNSDRDIAFEAGKSAWPRFTFSNVGQGMVGVEGQATDAQALAKGVDTVWDLDFVVPPEDANSGTYQAPPPGRWTLRILFVDTAGAEYDLSGDIDVQAAP